MPSYTKTVWKNLPDTTTPITASNLNNIEDGIEALENNQVIVNNSYNTSTSETYSCNYVNGLQTYSTTEQRVGTWIDGKPIYRKVLNITTASSSVTGWTNIIQIDNNLDNLIRVYGYTLFGNNKTPIPRYENSDYYLIFLASGNYLKYRCVGFTNANCNLVVEYTKTTD